ncbi:NAD kinase [Vagococcus lutrae]|uniref:NAD kinase n=1 Tax=Vagococcus lutrae TaxID=81947 RepID=UPI0023A9B509|nr:NAD kinase [Vagococcus lutrae]WEB81823.1 NAD kinase [Vagococcus lutrae]
MRIAMIASPSPQSQVVLTRLKTLLNKPPFEMVNERPDIVLTIGGDGTLLSGFHRYAHQLATIKFIGIHTGHLGFYTDWRDFELEELVDSLLHEEQKSVSYPLLDVEVTLADERQEKKHFLALNECIIKKVNTTMVADIFIKEEHFERFRGDGVSVSTPTGSTAYNKSVGGAVLHPRINALQLTEIASLNNRVYRTLGSPLVIAGDEWIEVRLCADNDYLLTIDQLSFPQSAIASIRYKIADERIHFASYRHTHFWRRVKDAFIEEEDTHNGGDDEI